MKLSTGTEIDGRYRIIRRIGAGGMAEVFEAEHVTIRRRVAIKVLRPTAAMDQSMVRRFEREAQAAGQIDTPHIVETLDFGRLPDGTAYMVMELLAGESFADRLKREGTVDLPNLIHIAQQLLTALGAAHDAEIIHRDIKPANVFLTRDAIGHDFVKVVDFGVSKFKAMNLTATHGQVLGSPMYMPPERMVGTNQENHPRIDVYAVGVMLYLAASGQRPFPKDLGQLLRAATAGRAPPLKTHCPHLPDAFCQAVHQAMHHDLRLRYQSTRELALALSEIDLTPEESTARSLAGLAQEPVAARPRRRRSPVLWLALTITAAAVATVAAGAAIVLSVPSWDRVGEAAATDAATGDPLPGADLPGDAAIPAASFAASAAAPPSAAAAAPSTSALPGPALGPRPAAEAASAEAASPRPRPAGQRRRARRPTRVPIDFGY